MKIRLTQEIEMKKLFESKKKGHNHWRAGRTNSFYKGVLSAIRGNFVNKKFQTVPWNNIVVAKSFEDEDTKKTLLKNIWTSGWLSGI